MSVVRFTPCAVCGCRLLWLRPWGFGEPRGVELEPRANGDVVIDADEGRYRFATCDDPPGRRHRLHWPCPNATSRARIARTGSIERDDDRTSAVAVVAHTHWDREWYSSFETFRVRLVDVVDEVLDVLDRDPAFTCFLLDGQTALVDDYLETRPESARRLHRLAIEGRLPLGPWEVLADEFLVSGETLVRNLQRGVRRANELGSLLRVGYLPDQFGHTAQLPQLLRLAGLGHVAVFRGIPDVIGPTAFWWVAPDGSRVRAERLPGGYCNAFRMGDDAKQLVARVRDLDLSLGDERVGELLLMNGCDHQPVQPWVPGLLEDANTTQDAYRFELRRLDDHLESQPVDHLSEWAGELRASAAANVTPSVVGNRVDLRIATAAAERAVQRRAEPLCALFLPRDRWPAALLDIAWRALVANAAHDTAAACSTDGVVRDALGRARAATDIGNALTAGALAQLAEDVTHAPDSYVVVNASGRPRRGVIEVVAAHDAPLHLATAEGSTLPTQVVSTETPVELDLTVPGREADVVLDLFAPERVAGRPVTRWTDTTVGTGRRVVLHMAGPGDRVARTGALHDRLRAWAAAHADDTLRVTLLQPPRTHALALAAEVPSFGWRAHEVRPGTGPSTALTGGHRWIANEHLRVDVDHDGGLAVTSADGLQLRGLHRLVDGSDVGDSYTWGPCTNDTIIDRPEHVRAATVETGPVRSRMVVTSTYRWPAHADDTQRSAARLPVEVRTTVDLLAGERFVRLTVELDNPSRDHRLRTHFALPARVNGSDAEAAFAVVHRGLDVDGSPTEAPLATFPAARFVDCSDGRVGLAIVHDGTSEYEVVDGGRELALTLFRSVGRLSRADNPMRPNQAGPEVALEDAQLPGRHRRRLALVPHRGTWEEADLFAIATDVLEPLEVVTPPPPGPTHTAVRPAVGSALAVTGAEVSAVTREDGELTVRLLRAAATPGAASVCSAGRPSSGRVVDLLGNTIERFAGTIELRPWQLVTIRVDER